MKMLCRASLPVSLLFGSFGCGILALLLLARDGLSMVDMAFAGTVTLTSWPLAHAAWWVVLALPFGGFESPIPCCDQVPTDCPSIGIIVPVYRENMREVAARLCATWQSLVRGSDRLAASTGFYVLSDSPAGSEPDERAAIEAATGRTGIPVTYRRRANRDNAKVGNVNSFLRSPDGRQLDLVIGFDADSLMTASAISRLVRIMCHDANSDVAMVQSQMFIRNPTTLIGMVDAWCRRRVGMLPAIVTSRVLGGAAYFGHNYIARAKLLEEASTTVLGNPVRSSWKGLCGYISSHDLAEATVLGEMGYRVLLDDQATGSFEESPATFPALLARECRWLRGSFQHLSAGWHRRGPLPQRFILANCAFQHLNALVGVIGLVTMLLVLLAGGALFGTTSAMWNSEEGVAAWSFTYVPVALLIIMIGLIIGPLVVATIWNARREAEYQTGPQWFQHWLRCLPDLVCFMVYGLLVGPVASFLLAESALVGLFRPRGWQTDRHQTGYNIMRAAVDLAHVSLVGAFILLVARSEPMPASAFLAMIGLPLLAAPITASAVSSPRLGRSIAQLGLLLVPSVADDVESTGFGDSPIPVPVDHVAAHQGRTIGIAGD